MITRRALSLGILSSPAFVGITTARAQNSGDVESFDQLIYPPIDSLDDPQVFGYNPATEAQKKKAREIIDATPKGPAAIDIAQSFVDRYFAKDPEAISQWPAPSTWNPLVVEFFQSTSYRANNDMIAWCAAFANWCIERAGRTGSRSAASQSFLSKEFKTTDSPSPGDLAVFTCYDKATGRSIGLGHVTFFKQRIANDRIKVVGGNQSADGHSSIISEREFVTTNRDVRRHVGDNYVLCTMRLNTFVRIV